MKDLGFTVASEFFHFAEFARKSAVISCWSRTFKWGKADTT